MPPAAKPLTQRKRTRKRKRRVASPSSSSLSSSSSGENEESRVATSLKTNSPSKVVAAAGPPPHLASDSDSETSISSSDSSSEEGNTSRLPRDTSIENQTKDPQKTSRKHLSPSPSPVPAQLPSFLPAKDASNPDDAQMKDQDLKVRFRQFWMAAVADGFQDDLEQIRKVAFRYLVHVKSAEMFFFCRSQTSESRV
jgi:ribosome assembly protein 3